jgi:hypothetical protein
MSAARPGDARAVVIRDVLSAEISGLIGRTGRSRLDIVDAGGGTGGFAVPLASQGHNVTVVDPSPDSLAAAQRRAAEMDVPLRAVQGDAADLAMLAGNQSADLVLCHSVLEYVDSPPAAMAAIAAVLRPGGVVSVLAASAVAAVIHRALAGRFADARRLLGQLGTAPGAAPGGPVPPSGTVLPSGAVPSPGAVPPSSMVPSPGAVPPSGAVLPSGPAPAGPGETAGVAAPAPGTAGAAGSVRRFTLAGIAGLIEEAGLRPGAAHGIRVFADLVPGAVADADPGAADALLALERAASAHPAFGDFAAQIHVLGYR